MCFPRRKNYFAHFPDIHKIQAVTSIFLQSFLRRKIHCFRTKIKSLFLSAEFRQIQKTFVPKMQKKMLSPGKSVVVDFPPFFFFCSKWKVVLHPSISNGTTNRLAPCKFFPQRASSITFQASAFPRNVKERDGDKKRTLRENPRLSFFWGGKGEQMRQPRLLLLLFRLKEE